MCLEKIRFKLSKWAMQIKAKKLEKQKIPTNQDIEKMNKKLSKEEKETSELLSKPKTRKKRKKK